jgi:hypothetical protein
MLLGLSTTLFGQITDASSVDFLLKKPTEGAWRTWTDPSRNPARPDTVGREAQWRITFSAATQTADLTKYTVTFPVGTITDTAALKSNVKMTFYDATTKLTSSVTLESSKVAIGASNEYASYDATVTPQVTVTADRSKTSLQTYTLSFMDGLRNPLSVDANIKKQTSTAKQKHMLITFNHNETDPGTYRDSSFHVSNDKADKVVSNTLVTGYVDSGFWPNGDSIYVTDQWGNMVPNFLRTNSDSLIISVGTDVGVFTALTHPAAAAGTYLDSISATSISIRGDASTSGTAVYAEGATLPDSTAAANKTILHYVTPADSDMAAIIVYLGEYGALPNGAGGIGVKFNAATGEDSTTFTFTLKGNVAEDSIIGAKPTNTTTVTREVLETGVENLIGTLDLSMSFGPHQNALSIGNITLTLNNKFGDPFASKTIGTDIDSVMFYYQYWRGGAVNSAMTTLLQQGGKVTSKRTRPATRLIHSNLKDVSSGNYGNMLVGGTTNASGVLTVSSVSYLGTTSHPDADSIMVIAVARKNADAVDTAWITVEPSVPVVFDLDTFTTNAASITPVEGAQFPGNLPIFALDTAYNRVADLDLKAGAGFLDAIATNVSATTLGMINFLIDDRDPTGATSTTVRDSIRIDSTSIAARTGIGAAVAADSSFVYDYTYARSDSSRLNLGSSGSNPMGLRLLYQGFRKLTIRWDPGTAGGYAAASGGATPGFDARSQDLGLFNLGSASLIDSVESLAMVGSADTAGAIYGLVIKFTLPQGNSIGPNLADSAIYVNFLDLPSDPDAGIPASITKDSVQLSTDAVNYYPALSVLGQDGDSIAIVPQLTFNATSADVVVYMRIHGFVNPTVVDTAGSGLYGIKVATEASPIPSTNPTGLSVVPASFGALKILPPGGTMPSKPKYLSQITQVADTLTVGDSALFGVVIADKYGNVINPTVGGTQGLIFKGPDTTLTGMNTVVLQKSTVGTGGHMYDSLWTSYDTIPGTTTIGIDSIIVIPAVAGTYTLTVMDSANATITDEVSLVVKGTTAGSMAIVEPLGAQQTATNTVLDSTFKVSLRDTYGNALEGTAVRFVVSAGSGTFVDSNGVTVAAPNDTLSVVSDASGYAMATLKTGDVVGAITVTVDVPTVTAVTAVTFSISTESVVPAGPSTINFKVVPDSLVQDTTAGASVTADISDAELVAKVYLRSIATLLELQSDGTFAPAATSDTAMIDSLIPTTPDDSVRFVGTLPVVGLATEVVYDIKVIDNIDSVTWSDPQLKYLIAPMAGKQDLTADATNVADLMRVVYLWLKPVGLTPRVIDYLGLDLDQTGDFEFDDINAVLALWKGETALLASAAEQERSAKVSLAYEAVDKANATLSINLDNQGSLFIAGFRVKYDVEKFVFGEVTLTERLEGFDVQFSNNETEGVYSVVVLNLQGRPITSGTGSILSIPVSAVGDKFDGEGEISLLTAGFETGVATEIDAEALSPKAVLPKSFGMKQNYPNPFNPSTTIAYDIPEGKEVFVRLNVYNIRGQLVRTLVNETMSEGSYKIQWDGKDNNGRYTSSGVYFYRIQAGDYSKTRKMVILK